MSCTEDRGELYLQKVRELQSSSLAGWQEQICGKYVLDWLHAQLPNRPGRSQIALDDYLER
jgi:hypothetical protein